MFNNLDELKDIISRIELEVNKAKIIFNELGVDINNVSPHDFGMMAKSLGSEKMDGDNKVVEGVFDGGQMIGPDGKKYSIPANYCSKSKLVEGDILKLIIKKDGSFVYKQIGPVERKRIKGTLNKDPMTGEFKVRTPERTYRVLKASVTYFHGNDNDEAIILVPQDGESIWAAVENIINSYNANVSNFETSNFETSSDDLSEFNI